jgi:hypothetical protein
VSIIEDIPQEQKTHDFIDKIADIKIHGDDLSFIKQASAATLLSFSLATIVCLGVSIALTFLWPLVVPLAVAVVLSGVLIKYLSSSGSDSDNEIAARMIIKNFTVSMLESYPNESYQQVLDKLEELSTSKEFYQQVKIFKEELNNVMNPKKLKSNYQNTTDMTQKMFTFIFDFIEKGISPDEQTTFKEAKEKYLNKLLKTDSASELLNNIIHVNSTSEQDDSGMLERIAKRDELTSIRVKQRQTETAFFKGIEAYINKEKNNTLKL